VHGALYRSIELKFHPRAGFYLLRAPADSGERGRLIDAPDQARQSLRESAPLLFRQKAPNLASTAVRPDGQTARMQARMRAAEFNACPMPRKYDFDVMSAVALLDTYVVLRNGDRLAVMAAFEAPAQRPAEQPHFQPRERQDWPEAAEGHDPGDAERGEAQ